MRLYLIAGEASGDLHGAALIEALRRLEPDIQIRCWGGDRMVQTGGALAKHYRDLAFMGFWEVLRNLRTILRNLDFCRKDIRQFQPDALVLIDYPGFNLRIARWAKQQGIPTVYYIAPQVWAWHESRIPAMRRDIDRLLVILPFEQAFFEKNGIAARYVGHPLTERIPDDAPHPAERENLIALLPGSRRQEISAILPAMLGAAAAMPDYRFAVLCATAQPDAIYDPWRKKATPNISFYRGDACALLKRSRAALVKSGTSTLETALCNTPQVVCYKGNPISYQIARRLVKTRYIALVNLILDRPLVRELIQHELHAHSLISALTQILQPDETERIRAGYAELRQLIGAEKASHNAALEVLALVRGKNS